MKRTTIKLPDDVDAKLRNESARRGVSISELTREAIEAHLGVTSRRKFLSAGSGHSGELDISERIEEILGEELTK